MTIIHDYEQALRVLKERNPLLIKTIDKILLETKPSYGLLFPDEPDARIFGEHKETSAVVELFWRELFHASNQIEVIASVPRWDVDYTGTVLSPAVRMTVGFVTDGWNYKLGNRTPLNTLFGVVDLKDPPYRRDKDLLPTLDKLARAAEIREFYHYVHSRSESSPFRNEIKRIF